MDTLDLSQYFARFRKKIFILKKFSLFYLLIEYKIHIPDSYAAIIYLSDRNFSFGSSPMEKSVKILIFNN